MPKFTNTKINSNDNIKKNNSSLPAEYI